MSPDRSVTILPLAAADPQKVDALLDAAFGADRHGRTAYKLRNGCDAIPPYSLAAFDEAGDLVGSLQTWPIELAGEDGRATPLLLVGPVAVRPDRQRLGIGRAMMARALAAIDAARASPSMLIGDAEYYGRFFGYDAAPTQQWGVPGPVERHRLLVRNPAGVRLPVEGTLRPRRAAIAA